MNRRALFVFFLCSVAWWLGVVLFAVLTEGCAHGVESPPPEDPCALCYDDCQGTAQEVVACADNCHALCVTRDQ